MGAPVAAGSVVSPTTSAAATMGAGGGSSAPALAAAAFADEAAAEGRAHLVLPLLDLLLVENVFADSQGALCDEPRATRAQRREVELVSEERQRL